MDTGSMTHTAKSATPRAWQRMLSGRRLDLLDPSPLDIEIEDIAHGLARVARWNGQTSGDWAYSVAQHSVEVEALFARQQPDACKLRGMQPPGITVPSPREIDTRSMRM